MAQIAESAFFAGWDLFHRKEGAIAVPFALEIHILRQFSKICRLPADIHARGMSRCDAVSAARV